MTGQIRVEWRDGLVTAPERFLSYLAVLSRAYAARGEPARDARGGEKPYEGMQDAVSAFHLLYRETFDTVLGVEGRPPTARG